MAITIVLTNQKGGVGKTTTTGALAVGLSKKGNKVLAIDLDPQGNLGFSLGLDIDEGYNIYDVMMEKATIEEAIQETENCDIVTSNILLSQAEIVLQADNRQLILQKALQPVMDKYDFIVIDTPPALNILTLNGYAMADHLIIPMSSEILSLVGLVQLQETVEAVKDSVNPQLNVLGILLTKYNKNTNLSKDVLEMAETIAEQVDSEVFDAKVRTSVSAAEAPAHGMCILDYAPKSNPAIDYQKFVDEVYSKIKA